MSKVAIQGNASGTGTFTIAAPNSNTDRTLTLPDEAGTVLTDTAPSVSGDITFNQEASGSPYPEQQIKWSNDSTTANGFYISQDSDRNGRIWHEQGLEVLFGTSNTERMRINSSGYLLVGTTVSSLADLRQHSDTGVLVQNNGNSIFAGQTSAVLEINRSDNDNNTRDVVMFWRNSDQPGYISASNTTVNYVTSSDYRLKENVVDMTNAIDRVKALKPSRFNWISNPDVTVDGFLAHEAQAVVPEAVSGEKDAVDDEGNPKYQGIDQSKLVPLLTGALQEAIARIETLEAEVATLKGASA